LIAILDYGSGNLRSAQRAFELAHPEVVVTSDPEVCIAAAGLVVPGVGAFAACMAQLLEVGGDDIVSRRLELGKPTFGICVGMQIFFQKSDEKINTAGLGVLPGEISLIKAPILPHIGWNSVSTSNESKLFAGVENSSFYFVHSYAVKTPVAGAVNATSNYGENFLAAVELGAVTVTQFHPEKSGAAGAKLIANWVGGL